MPFDYSEALTHEMNHVLKLYRHRVDLLVQKYDVYPGQPPLLIRLSQEDGQPQMRLAERLHIKPATMTVMINRMEKTGLVCRRQDSSDQRISRVFLTDKGRAAAAAVQDALQTVEEQCFSGCSSDEKVLFRSVIQRMKRDLSAGLPVRPGE